MTDKAGHNLLASVFGKAHVRTILTTQDEGETQAPDRRCFSMAREGSGRGDHPEAEGAPKGSAQAATCPVMEWRISERSAASDMPHSARVVTSIMHAKLFVLPF
ncbi:MULTISPECIES: hypothetical protein [unclassified Mesorhizobium]|uniref:hypothetical protein n=1 Tax=unclassified Mesorhizobium TaxID=325217 RepID=UPI000BB080D4|nr:MULTISPECIES: hypothetical protein [unclassified Mesorhizobium]PBB25641.1 hypothetical protein CK232_15000 [Mesorhizobium sp. WSM4304]PBB72097.1 hypothetical protein CK227_28455 [Mesorhizobium sp. WSM4308]